MDIKDNKSKTKQKKVWKVIFLSHWQMRIDFFKSTLCTSVWIMSEAISFEGSSKSLTFEYVLCLSGRKAIECPLAIENPITHWILHLFWLKRELKSAGRLRGEQEI